MSNSGNRNGAWGIAVLCGVALASGACAPENKQVGSACKNGVCPAALATEAPVCLASSRSAEIVSVPTSPFPCLPEPLVQDDAGKVQCRLVWLLPSDPPAGTPAHCSDSPLLTARPGSDNECVLKQISKPSDGAASGDGWFYDPAPDKNCVAAPGMDPKLIEGSTRVRFTPAAEPPSGVLVFLTCAVFETAEAGGNLARSDGAMCALPPNSAKHAKAIGDSCLPKVPTGSFQESEVYVETVATDCETGVCLVAHLQGDPTPDCKEVDSADVTGCIAEDGGVGACFLPKRCADQAEVDERVFCSCRCDGPGVDPKELCDCRDGFTCVEVLEEGPAALRGSYCMRNGT